MAEELALEAADRLQTGANTGFANENVVELISTPALPMEDFHRFNEPEQETTSPLEYVFHLLNGVYGRTVIDLECGSGLHTVILAKLGAQVISIDRSDSNIEMAAHRLRNHAIGNRATLIQARGSSLPAPDACADRVLCHSILKQADPIVTARQIRRVLKPGGSAIFHEVMDPHFGTTRPAHTLPRDYLRKVSRAVGVPGRCKEFWLMTGLLRSAGIEPSSPVGRITQRLDAMLFRTFPFARSLASVVVWEARKER